MVIKPIAPETEPRSKWHHIEAWLRENCPTRVNVVTMRPEWYDHNIDKWVTFNDYKRNSILRQLRDEYYTVITGEGEKAESKTHSMATTKPKLDEIIESNFSPRVDVFKEYFERLPEREGCETINQLASTVTIKDPDNEDGVKPSKLWPEYLKKWLVACVANFHNDMECENQTMLVMIGSQNDGKTTWLNNLVPKQFNPKYRFCSGIQDPRGKDAQTLLVSMFLVNIDDQLGSITKKDADGIKNLITMPRVTIRMPYDKYTDDHPHRASMCGSLNYTGFLTDPTGNRRYLPFALESINWKYLNVNSTHYVNIDHVWSEAYSLWRAGYRYKFADNELKELEAHNAEFRAPSAEEDLIDRYLTAPDPWDQLGSEQMTTTEVLLYLTECAGPNLKKPLHPYAVKRYMENNGYEMKQRTHHGTPRVRVWSVNTSQDSSITGDAHQQPNGKRYDEFGDEIRF